MDQKTDPGKKEKDASCEKEDECEIDPEKNLVKARVQYYSSWPIRIRISFPIGQSS